LKNQTPHRVCPLTKVGLKFIDCKQSNVIT
jgi:hypothetical protein